MNALWKGWYVNLNANVNPSLAFDHTCMCVVQYSGLYTAHKR